MWKKNSVLGMVVLLSVMLSPAAQVVEVQVREPTPTLRDTGMAIQRQIAHDLDLRIQNTANAISRQVRERSMVEANRRLVQQGQEVVGFVDLVPEEEVAMNFMDMEYRKHQQRLNTLSAVNIKLGEKGNYTAMQQLEKALMKENERHERKMRQLLEQRGKAKGKGKGKKDNPGLKKGHYKHKGEPQSVTVIHTDHVIVHDAHGNAAKGNNQGHGKQKNQGKGKGKGKK